MHHTHEDFFPEWNQIPQPHQLDLPIRQTEYLINGTIHHWEGPQEPVYSPVCLKGQNATEIGSYPLLEETQALQALEAACQAYDQGRGRWPTMSVAQRIEHVEEFLYQMVSSRDEVVTLLMWEIGKPYADACKEYDRTMEYIRDTVDAVKELDRQGARIEIQQGVFAQIRRAPLGVALCMGPFNYPLNETFTTLIPALIMGNTVVFKPPKLGVLLHQPLLKAFRDSFPPGVVNTVYGDGKTVVSPMMTSGRIAVLAFIGSSGVANILKHQHPKPHRLRSVLGLEAKNPAVVLSHADLKTAVSECVLGALSFNGQRCTALKILFVHEHLIDSFLTQFTEALTQLRCGMPWDEDVSLTPLPEPGKPAWLTELVNDAVGLGAEVVNPGGATTNQTFFYPALMHPVASAAKLYSVEQFGPIIPVVPFRELDEPIRYIRESNYGQQASIFGSDPQEVARLIDPLVNQVCRLNINSQCQRGPDTFPFTGRKDSAEGTLSVSDALRVFTIRTLVAAKKNTLNQQLLSTIMHERSSQFLSRDFIF